MRLYFVVLCAIIKVVISQKQSPCPDIFSYESETNERDRWYGTVSLRTAEDLSGVWLRIVLDRPAVLLGNWFGEASSTDNIEYLVRNRKYKLEAGPPVSIRFFVKYNTAQPAPKIIRIALNGKTICTTQRNETVGPTMPTLHISEFRPTVSSNGESIGPLQNADSNDRRNNFNANQNGNSNRESSETTGNNDRRNNLSSNSNRESSQTTGNNDRRNNFNFNQHGNSNRETHTREPSNNNRRTTPRPVGGGLNFDDETESDSDFFQGDFATILRPAQDKPTSLSDSISSTSSNCGVVAAKATPLISHGQETLPGQWPWHAALYLSRGIQLRYICGATLITERHVVTAAHCVTKPYTNTPVNPNNMLVYLGKYDLITFGPEVQDRSVSNIFVHPDYNNTVFFNDIAVLKLSTPVKITNFVRTCCLWDGDTNLENIISDAGSVVGWGFDEKGKLSNKLLQAKMPVVSTVTCIYSNRDFFSRFTFEKNFCAGFRNGTSVCNGDSGGGMVFPKKGTSGQNTVWQIRGLVSVGVALQGQGVCDTSQYIVFTDVAKHTHWIRQVVAN